MANEDREFSFTTRRFQLGETDVPFAEKRNGVSTQSNAIVNDGEVKPDITVAPDSIIHYQFEDDTSTEAVDQSGNGNTGSFVGGPTYISDSAVGSYALSTDGSSGVVYPDTGVIRPSQDWSVVLFFRDPNLTGSDYRFYWSARDTRDIKLYYYGGELVFDYYDGGQATTDGTAVSDNTWHLVVLRNNYTEGVRSISVDTVDYGTNGSFSAKSRSNANTIGYSAGNGNNSVDVDGYRLFDSVISKDVEENIYTYSNIS